MGTTDPAAARAAVQQTDAGTQRRQDMTSCSVDLLGTPPDQGRTLLETVPDVDARLGTPETVPANPAHAEETIP